MKYLFPKRPNYTVIKIKVPFTHPIEEKDSPESDFIARLKELLARKGQSIIHHDYDEEQNTFEMSASLIFNEKLDNSCSYIVPPEWVGEKRGTPKEKIFEQITKDWKR